MQNITRREFIKTAALGFVAVNTVGFLPNKTVFAADNCLVKTRYGSFNGFVDKNGVKTWLGIPYAKPPVKNLRWQAPQNLKPTNKTFDAKKFGFRAIQDFDEDEETAKIPQSEDCLTLNIWKKSEKKNLPVMVFIHGGAFVGESASDGIYYGSNFAAENDVVLVSFDYRLNVFGFLNLAPIDSTFEDSGYLGIKDQIAALKWVKENISEFGGNPDNITIFGESAGSTANMLLTVIPAAKGLFDKTIPQSGHSFMYNTTKVSGEITELFMKTSGAKTVGELMKKSAEEIKSVYQKLSAARGMSLMDYMPTCDGKFLPLNPFKALNEGAAKDIKFLTGTTADEWRYFMLGDDKFFENMRKNPTANSRIYSKYTAKTPEAIYKSWLKNRPDTEDNYAEFTTQIDWRVGQELAAEYQSKYNDVYFYLFSQESTIKNLRSCHAVDLPFTFYNPDELYPNPSKDFSRIIQASWTAFATTGNPNNALIPRWEKYLANNRQTMELNSKGCACRKNLNAQNLNELRYVYES